MNREHCGGCPLRDCCVCRWKRRAGEGHSGAFLGQGQKHEDCIGFLQAAVGPALKASLQPLMGCYRFYFPIVQTSENWCMKYLTRDKCF